MSLIDKIKKSVSTPISVSHKEKKDYIKMSKIEKKIISILDSKIRPAVARDGGDIKFQEFKDGYPSAAT